MKQSKVIIHTDGGAIGNPGPSAIGIVIEASKVSSKDSSLFGEFLDKKRYAEYIGKGTNNQAEYKALIFALKKVKSLFGKKKAKSLDIECYMDSQLIANQVNGEYKILDKALQPLFIEVWNLKQDFKNAIFKFIPREKNKEADRLVKEGLSKSS